MKEDKGSMKENKGNLKETAKEAPGQFSIDFELKFNKEIEGRKLPRRLQGNFPFIFIWNVIRK